MVGRDHRHAPVASRTGVLSAAEAGKRRTGAEDGLGGDSAGHEDDARREQVDLAVEERSATLRLRGLGVAVLGGGGT